MKSIYRFLCAAAVVFFAVACTDMPEESFSGIENHEGEEGLFCYLPEIEFDEPETKGVTYDSKLKVSFDSGDKIGVWPYDNDEDEQYQTYKLTVNTDNEAKANFKGGKFELTDGESYTSVYPMILTDLWPSIQLSFANQKQMANDEATHLKSYLYAWASAYCDNNSATFTYSFNAGFIQFVLSFEGLTESTTFKKVKLVADANVFNIDPTLNVQEGTLTKGTLTNEISIDLDNIEIATDGTLTVNMAAAPFGSATMKVQAIDAADKVYTSTAKTIPALLAGKAMRMTRTLSFIDTEHNMVIDASDSENEIVEVDVDGDLYVTIVQSGSGAIGSMTIQESEGASKHPDNVYITIVDNYPDYPKEGDECQDCDLSGMALNINLPNSHVVLSAEAGETIGSITTNTSLNTLVLGEKITVGSVAIQKDGGGLTVDGKITGKLTVPNNAAVDQTEPEKIWVKINESAAVKTIEVAETNCNLYIAGTVEQVVTSAAQTTVEGTVTQNLTADGTAEVVVTSSAVVEDATLVAKSESIIYLDADAQIPENDSSYYGDQEEGEFTGTIRPNAKPVASVDGVDYMSLESAIAAVPTTGIKTTITLLKDLTAEDITDNVVFGGSFAANTTTPTLTSVTSKNVTLNLNGHNITSAKTLYLAGGTLEITGTGTIETTGSGVAAVGVRYAKANATPGVDLTSKRTLTIGENVTLKGAYGLNVFGTNEETIANSIEVNMNGYIDGSNLFILGNLWNASNVVNVNVNGTIVAPTEGDKAGVALNGNANVVIGANASISAPTGIEVRAGNLTVNGGTIRGTKAPTAVTPNGSGTTTVGAGIAVAQHTTTQPINVTISGGTVEGHTGLYLINPQNNTDQDIEQVNVSVTGGTFNAINEGTNSVAKGNNTDNATLSITGGTFNSDPTEYVAAGYTATQTGDVWTVSQAKVAQVNGVEYATLAEAFEAVGEDQTITILTDIDFSQPDYSGYKWAGSVYNPLELCANGVTIDLDGHTFSNMGNCAIAIGHLLAKDGRISNLTIKNGTMLAGKTDNVTNSYVLLIAGVENMTIKDITTNGGINVCSGSTGVVIEDCTINGTKYYTVCAQTGSQVTIKGTTYTKNTDATVANKSMFWIQGASTDSDMVTSTNPTGAFGASSITIEGGTYTVDFTNGGVFYLTSGVAPSLKGGTYNFNANAYCAPGYEATQSENVWTVAEIQGVAQIGSTRYASLAAAIAAVPTDGTKTTIQMIANETMAENTVIEIAATKNIVLDLNGKTISSIGGSTTASYYFIQNRGTLEINDFSSAKNGKITSACTIPSPGYSKEYVTVYNIGGTLTLAAGTVETTSGGLSYAINNSSNAWGQGDDKETVFIMTGGTINSPSGDAGLRVYQNCAKNATPFSHNTVTISGGTIASGGIFLDNYIYNPDVNTTGSGILTNVTISGGEIHGLIDMKLRHTFNTTFNITGGTFVDSKLWVRKHSEWNSAAVAEPTAPVFFISGGNFSFVPNMAFGLEYDCDGTSWTSYTNPYSITGGTFNVDPATFVAAGYEATHSGNVWTVDEMQGVAQIGSTRYASLAAAIAAVPTDGTKTTIQMIANETMAENTVIEIAATKNIVLDLNGKTISSIGGSTTASYYFIQNRGTLEINDFSSAKNGKITSACTIPSPGYSKEYVTVYNIGGTLTLAAGTVETTSGGLSYAINNSSNAWGINDNKETVFTMTGGTINAPSGDAALRVYQNCADTTTPFSHNTVTISGGTIASGGIFLDNYIYKPNENTTGAGINTNVTITGGEIHGLIDMKLRHAFHTTFTISGGTFVDSKLWVRKHSEWNSVVAEPTEPIFIINGKCNFTFVDHKAFGLAYDCDGTSWTSYTRPYSILAGSFNENPSAFVPTEGFAVTQEDGVYTVGITESQGGGSGSVGGDPGLDD